MASMPLQKFLQKMGMGPKRAVRSWIDAGRVSVDGTVTRRYAHPVTLESRIEKDGELLARPAKRTVLLMHKPKKHITAFDDDGQGRPGLGQYLPGGLPPLFPVGRLDFNSEGALLWTNDGALARRVLHPETGLPKTYGVKIRGHLRPDDEGLSKMRAGMRIGKLVTRPAQVRIIGERTRATWVEITITEGKHRQIRKMCSACNFQIVKLRRTRIGPVELGDLNPRCVRPLTRDELDALDRAVGFGSSGAKSEGQEGTEAARAGGERADETRADTQRAGGERADETRAGAQRAGGERADAES